MPKPKYAQQSRSQSSKKFKGNRQKHFQHPHEISSFIMGDDLPMRKTWSYHDLISIRPLTDAQREMFEAFERGDHIVAYGSAGSGKTFLGMYLALVGVLDPDSRLDRIIIVRSAVQTRDMGFIPGDLDEKMSVYEAPYRDVSSMLIGRPRTYDDMKRAGVIEFCTTSFVRSLTWDNAIVLVDEGQSMSFHEINSVVTRLGHRSRLIFLGDLAQNDLIYKKNDTSGMERFLRVAHQIPDVCLVKFTREDIVRSEFVKNWIIACEETM